MQIVTSCPTSPVDSSISADGVEFIPNSLKCGTGESTTIPISALKRLRPFKTKEIKVLLLENISAVAVNTLTKADFQVESLPQSIPEQELMRLIEDVHIIGVRSKTQLTEKVLACAKKLLVIGCFCIGTNQVNLEYAASRGICVFNSPFSNSRSVAEMTIANVIFLARQLGDRNIEMHQSIWKKVSKNCFEIRGKTLGIIGYGHIGSQLSVLAEAMGMNVIFYDILQLMPLGRAISKDTLAEVLNEADFVTLHVPSTPETKNMIGEVELARMKQGSYLINASRGNVVNIPALSNSLKSKHLSGAAIDVYPVEPHSNGNGFVSELISCPNTILSPHIGGSTEEAQTSIGLEVATNLIKYISNGVTLGSVNFPEIDLRALNAHSKAIRVLNVHRNVPGVLKQINLILSRFNIEKQICDSKGPIAYLMADVLTDNESDINDVHIGLSSVSENIISRVVY